MYTKTYCIYTQKPRAKNSKPQDTNTDTGGGSSLK